MRKIAIVGRCDNTRGHAPFDDDSWEIWGLAWDNLLRVDRLFEVHDHWKTGGYFEGGGDTANEDYLAWLRGCACPIYLLEADPDVPTSVAYPVDEVKKLVGGNPYLESSVGYMLALAILENADRIGIWGVDLSLDEEYAYQRPNTEYLIGLARGRGIKVFVPPDAALLSSAWDSGRYGVGHGDQQLR